MATRHAPAAHEDEADLRTFEEFLAQHEAALLRSAVFLTGDRGSGEQLLHRVLVEAYPHWHTMADPERALGEALVHAYARGPRSRVNVVPPPQLPAGPAETGRVRAIVEQAAVVRARRARRRRRRVLTAVAAAAVVATAAASVATTLASGGSPPARGLTPPPLVSLVVDGVTATWLPEEVEPYSSRVDIAPVGDTGRVLASRHAQRSQRTATAPPVNTASLLYDLVVGRGGGPADLDAMFADGGGEIDSALPVPAPSWTEAAGRRALLLARPNQRGLWWTDGDVLLGVNVANVVDSAAAVAELRQIAAGVVVGPAPAGPADRDRAAAEVRDAADTVFDRNLPPEQALSVVVDGGTLVEALARFRREQPESAASVRSEVTAVYFVSPDLARVAVHMAVLLPPGAFAPTNPSRPMDTTLTLDVTWTEQSGWRIPRASYCGVVSPVLNCNLPLNGG